MKPFDGPPSRAPAGDTISDADPDQQRAGHADTGAPPPASSTLAVTGCAAIAIGGLRGAAPPGRCC